MHLAFETGPYLAQADVVLVLNASVPWMPRVARPDTTAKVIHISADPLVTRHPFREYESDLFIAGDPVAGVRMLREVLRDAVLDKAAIGARRAKVNAEREARAARREALAISVKDQTPIHPAWLAYCINKAKARDAIVVTELGVSPDRLDLTEPFSFIGTSLAGGLGAGIGSALGAKLAAPEREVIACVGDGSYMFGNPVPFHYVARAEKLPTLTVVANNRQWLAVHAATLVVCPDGAASKTNVMPIQDLNPSPAG